MSNHKAIQLLQSPRATWRLDSSTITPGKVALATPPGFRYDRASSCHVHKTTSRIPLLSPKPLLLQDANPFRLLRVQEEQVRRDAEEEEEEEEEDHESWGGEDYDWDAWNPSSETASQDEQSSVPPGTFSTGDKYYTPAAYSRAQALRSHELWGTLFGRGEDPATPGLRFAMKVMFVKLTRGVSAASCDLFVKITACFIRECGLQSEECKYLKQFRSMKTLLRHYPCHIYRRVTCAEGCGVIWAQKDVAEGFKELGTEVHRCPKCASVNRGRHGFLFTSVREKLQKLFLSKTFCSLVTAHATRKQPPSGHLEDLVDGTVWGSLKKTGFFTEPRNIAFLFTLDGCGQ
eukprot:Nk52_evm13s235 gene=Nk52_evmTU13s235